MQKKRSIKLLESVSRFLMNEGHNVYKYSDLAEAFYFSKKEKQISVNTTLSNFIDFIIEQLQISKIKLSFPNRREIRYLLGDVSDFELALSLRPHSFLSHHSAVYINGLIDTPSKNIYVNQEQPPKRIPPGVLRQESIDLAFSRECRVSKTKAKFDKKVIYILNGMYTGQYGVIDFVGKKGGKIRSTNLERTLVDISVRPVYAGGTLEVLKAYRAAAEGNKISIENLIETLKSLKYIYPYHQVIGFYLDRAGIDGSAYFLDFEMNFDFYLAHHMGETLYSPKWHLYYPKEFDSKPKKG